MEGGQVVYIYSDLFANVQSPELNETNQRDSNIRFRGDSNEDNDDGPSSPVIKVIEGSFWEKYKPLGTLGKGSSAIVKKAQCRLTKSKYAVKIVRTSDPEFISRAVEEFRRVYKLSHPSIAKVYRLYIDESQGHVYTVMELCTDKSISDWTVELDFRGKFDEAKCRKVFGKLVAAVRVLHSRGIVHRDLTPENILISDNGNVKILDFNVAKFFSIETIRHSPRKQQKFKYGMMTQTGNPSYRAPEVVLGGIYR